VQDSINSKCDTTGILYIGIAELSHKLGQVYHRSKIKTTVCFFSSLHLWYLCHWVPLCLLLFTLMLFCIIIFFIIFILFSSVLTSCRIKIIKMFYLICAYGLTCLKTNS